MKTSIKKELKQYVAKDNLAEFLAACNAIYEAHILIGATKAERYLRWGHFVKKIGLDMRTAQRMVVVAKKFNNPETHPVLVAAGNKSKIMELLVLSKEDIIKIAKGATDAAMTLDDIKRMTVKELRQTLKKYALIQAITM